MPKRDNKQHTLRAWFGWWGVLYGYYIYGCCLSNQMASTPVSSVAWSHHIVQPLNGLAITGKIWWINEATYIARFKAAKSKLVIHELRDQWKLQQLQLLLDKVGKRRLWRWPPDRQSQPIVSCFRVWDRSLGWLGSWGRPGEEIKWMSVGCVHCAVPLMNQIKYTKYFWIRVKDKVPWRSKMS